MSDKYLILKGCAGIGNRLVTVFSAINYAIRNDRILIVDWEDGQFDFFGTNAFSKLFEINGVKTKESYREIPKFEMRSHSSVLFKERPNKGIYDLYFQESSNLFLKLPSKLYPKGTLNKLKQCWKPISNKQIISSDSDLKAIANLFNRSCLVYGGDLKNNLKANVLYYSDFLPDIDYDQLKEYLGIKPELAKKINEFSDKFNFKSEVTAIHVRHTDKKPVASIHEFILKLKSSLQTKHIYLSTDSVEIEKLFLDQFQNVIMYPKYKPILTNEGLHQWALYNKAEDKKFQICEESVIEMFLLSKARILYYQGNSTFSGISKVFHSNKKLCYDWQS